MAPVCEEAIFRGILYPFLKQRFQPAFGLWMSSLLFATIHANAMTFVPLTMFALVLVWLYERTETLLAPILIHALFNAANFTLLVIDWDPFQKAGG
jgi:membrane protease YdiL (CAAX protease family)